MTESHLLVLALSLFAIGTFGIFFQRNSLIKVLLCIELQLLAANLLFVGFSYFKQDLAGQIITIFTLTVAAAEAAIGLAILVLYYRQTHSIEVDDIHQLRG